MRLGSSTATDTVVGLGLVLAMSGCAAEIDPTTPAPPFVTSVATPALSVGEPFTLRASHVVTHDEGWVDLTFRGEFFPSDGAAAEAVDLTVPLRASEDGTIVWERFGGYRVPFGRGDRAGTFVGDLRVANRFFDGRSTGSIEGRPMAVRLDVRPSLVVLDFRAVGDTWVSDCADPAPIALHGVPYGMRVRVAGAEATSIDWHVSEGLLVEGEPTRETTRIQTTPEGGEGAIVMAFSAVPAHVDGYRMTVDVVAHTADGGRIELAYPFMVRRPLEVYFTTPMQIAEIFEPEPVTGCIPGGPGGVDVSYSESHSETRTRAVQTSLSRGWEQSYGEQHAVTWGGTESVGASATESRTTTVSDARTEGGSVTTTDMFSTTNGRSRTHAVDFSATATDSYGWTIGGESGWSEQTGETHSNMWDVGGSAGVNLGVVSLGGEASKGYVNGESDTSGTSGGASWGASGQSSSSASAGVSDATTESSSSTEGRSRAVGAHWGRTQTYAESTGYSTTLAWEQSRTYSEAETRSESIGESLGASISETLTVSTTEAEALETSATIGAGLMGAWYRQTTRLARTGIVVAYDLCGNGSPVGQVVLDDWTWAPDLAIGDACLPASNFPQAECRLEPCSGR
ncbi:MAG: hypothetical protein IT379_20625 [Deltaproteobacteria bacterium]|nr:hypothetical protein [Deltaproteobacteria bacterium]